MRRASALNASFARRPTITRAASWKVPGFGFGHWHARETPSLLKRESSEAQRQAPAASTNVQVRPSTAPSAPLGTGHGRREESHVVWVDFDRASDTPAETITIYYDSYRNLLARGILQPAYGRRDPDPFPNTTFAPDPWR